MSNIAFLTILCLLLKFVFVGLHAQSDQYAKIANKVTITSETDSWLKISVPFNIITHPRIEKLKGNRPTTICLLYTSDAADDA